MNYFRHLFKTVRQQGPWYSLVLAASLVAGVFSFSIWHQFGADRTIPVLYLWVAHGLGLLNLSLSLYTLDREAFASYLLIGTTLLYEIFVLIFLYLI